MNERRFNKMGEEQASRSYLLFALMQIGNPIGLRKKIKPCPMLPDSDRDRAGQRT